jgi:hypothetical protein
VSEHIYLQKSLHTNVHSSNVDDPSIYGTLIQTQQWNQQTTSTLNHVDEFQKYYTERSKVHACICVCVYVYMCLLE